MTEAGYSIRVTTTTAMCRETTRQAVPLPAGIPNLPQTVDILDHTRPSLATALATTSERYTTAMIILPFHERTLSEGFDIYRLAFRSLCLDSLHVPGLVPNNIHVSIESLVAETSLS